ncbi:MAG TPA: endonuclease domain-containing protein [Gracilimonas sp.]|uniref:endonuclease domain-containing protein n=1 Tax=Gracilimonas sp. TaxID=1974203 RepID=UPI002D9CC87B|nr:endonuclease domain-containing protein [Gracilimonas sp.]
MHPYNRKLKHLARQLRKNSTLSEVLLWKQIKDKALGVEFHRQVPILDYIVDFYCHEIMMVIEIDGITHDHPEKFQNDKQRQERIEALGVIFARITDSDVKHNMHGVLMCLQDFVKQLKAKQT